jgi:hypothetical protein
MLIAMLDVRHRAGWTVDNVLDIYSTGARFEYRRGHRLPWWGFRGFLQCLKQFACIIPRWGHERSLPINRLSTILPSYGMQYKYW